MVHAVESNGIIKKDRTEKRETERNPGANIESDYLSVQLLDLQ